MKHINDNITPTKYKQLSESERINIEKLYKQGLSYSEIAKRTSRNKSTIMREIKRNGTLNLPSVQNQRQGTTPYRYHSKKAQNNRDSRFARPKNLHKFSHFIKYSNDNITPQTSLEDLYWNYKKEYPNYPCPCLKSIYNWAHLYIIEFSWGQQVIKSPRQKSNKEPVEDRKSIHQRKLDFGIEYNDITTAGHYQIDTIYDEDKKGGALTFNETGSTKLYSYQLENRKAVTTNKALRKIISEIGPENILSITSDNGVEFAYSKVIEECYDIKWYYCDPYSSYQRGQNERLNRDIRKYIPKGQSIKKVAADKYYQIIASINNKPRRKFKGLSANEYKEYIQNNQFQTP